MELTRYIAAVVLVALLPLATFAGTEAGDFEVGGQVMYMSPQNEQADDMAFFVGTLGIFLSPHVEGIVRVTYFISGDHKSGSVGPGAEFYLTPEADMTLVFGGTVQFDVGDNADDSDPQYDVHGGVKFFVTERASLNALVGWMDILSSDDDKEDTGTLYTSLGVSLYL